jgi:4-amino-4-deoxy-L-arabinose transferase-like glycosyltransferase
MAAPQPQARATPRSAWVEWLAQHPNTLLTLATVLALLPFIGKPFNIDDPLFVWVAQHIHSHPLDPYGFKVNWYGFDWPLWDITKNPPLACYYLAIFGNAFGWSEAVLHAAFLLPAIGVVLGAHRLAKHFCKRPLLAALAALFTPVFLVSSTTVMCDVLMLAFWVWSVVFWIEGTGQKRPGPFAIAALLMMLAALTKYFGACLIPLVAAWSIAGKRPVKEWLGWLAIPIVFLIAYQFATRELYGHGLLADAGKYAAAIHQASIVTNLDLILTALAFTGGCFAMVTLFAPFLWSRRALLIGTGISLAACAILLWVTKGSRATHVNAAQIVQILFWASGGVSLLALAITDLCRRRGADSLLLACWVLGTFIFTAFFNWIINGRSLLPIAIPAGILLARRLETRFDAGIKWPLPVLLTPGLLGAGLSIWVTVADYSFAVAPRTAARAISSTYGANGHRLWFQGHWGFQYYMQNEGATALDMQHPKVAPGDYIAMPSHNSNVYPMKSSVTALNTFLIPIHGCLSTMNAETGAGFYASAWGRLPFAFGAIPSQFVDVFAYDPNAGSQQTNSPKAK